MKKISTEFGVNDIIKIKQRKLRAELKSRHNLLTKFLTSPHIIPKIYNNNFVKLGKRV